MNHKKVIFIGDSRKMKGGVSTVIKTLEKSSLWKKYNCCWLETQINSKNKLLKIFYLIKGFVNGLFIIPQYNIVHFQTAPGASMITLFPIFVYALFCRKKIIVQLHVGNQIKTYVNDWIFKFWTSNADEILFLGKTWEDETNKFLNKDIQTDFLYNPVPLKDRQKKFKKYFLFAAFFNTNKGYDILLKAFKRVIEKYPEWKLIMCGDGDTYGVMKCIEELHLKNNIILPGWIDGEEKEKLFSEAYAYCMTSYQEGLPMSVLESMSYGVPVISTPVGCLPEFLTHKENVLFFDFGDTDALVMCMLNLIENQELRYNIAKKAYDIIQAKFTIEAITAKLDRIYNRL